MVGWRESGWDTWRAAMRVRAPGGEGKTEIQYTEGEEEDSMIFMKGLYFVESHPCFWLFWGPSSSCGLISDLKSSRWGYADSVSWSWFCLVLALCYLSWSAVASWFFYIIKEEVDRHGGRETLKEVGCIWPYNINVLLCIMHSAPKLTVSAWLRLCFIKKFTWNLFEVKWIKFQWSFSSFGR